MMHGRTTNEARLMRTFTKQFQSVASSGVSSWHIQNRNCVPRSRAKLCRQLTHGMKPCSSTRQCATSAKETHLCKSTSETGYLPFRIKRGRVTKKTKYGQRVSRATGNDYMCPRKAGKIHEKIQSTASHKVGPD